ncbi:MAG: extracellular solute-binding protein [Bifidobacteriaceae bacterium]|jgi:raffinose/stachyose/melibiose transport system substrate-binding protein|nr:extracellular solute-binding protein [Bifidobacteriaceae bacterium]
MKSTNQVRRLAAAGAALALAVSLAACAPGSDQTDDGAGSPGPTSAEGVNKDVASMGDLELILWDQEVRDSQASQFQQLVDGFLEKYPNVTINRVEQSFDDLTTTLGLALSDPNPPDIVQANNSRSDMGAFVGAGQLLSLEPYAEAYGWRDRFPETVLKNMTYSSDGAEFGSGQLYGLPQAGEIVGVFYNKDKLAALGLSLPQTWADFEAALAAAKTAGEVPIMLGNVEGWPAVHVFGPIQGAYVPANEVNLLGMGNAGAAWTTAGNLSAATELADWAAQGYFNEGYAGADDAQAAEEFAAGTGVFMIAGSWNGAMLNEAMGAKAGFFAPPPAVAGGPIATTGGTSLPFAITAGSKHPDAAAAFIDYVTSDEAMKILAATGNVPVLGAQDLVPADQPVQADIFAAFGQASENGALLPYLDWATPTFGGDTLQPGLQDLLAAKTTPSEFLDRLQADYAGFVG